MKSMKTVQVMKKTLGLILVTMALATTACQKSSDSPNTNQRFVRNTGLGYNTATGSCNSGAAHPGVVWGPNYSQIMPYFLVNNTGIGTIDGTAYNSPTGLRIYGSNGQIAIEVWDSVAVQNCDPYRLIFTVDQTLSQQNGGIVAKDNDGLIQLTVQQGTCPGTNISCYVGQIGFQNSDTAGGAGASLGQYAVPMQSFGI